MVVQAIAGVTQMTIHALATQNVGIVVIVIVNVTTVVATNDIMNKILIIRIIATGKPPTKYN